MPATVMAKKNKIVLSTPKSKNDFVSMFNEINAIEDGGHNLRAELMAIYQRMYKLNRHLAYILDNPLADDSNRIYRAFARKYNGIENIYGSVMETYKTCRDDLAKHVSKSYKLVRGLIDEESQSKWNRTLLAIKKRNNALHERLNFFNPQIESISGKLTLLEKKVFVNVN